MIVACGEAVVDLFVTEARRRQLAAAHRSLVDHSAGCSSNHNRLVSPVAVRITRMERRTGLGKAALAFSIRCERSATWTSVSRR